MQNRTAIQRSIDYFRDFDLFGIRPTLYFKGRKKSGTSFGLFLTFLFVVFTTLCFFFFGQDLYYRKNPQLRYNEQYDPFPKEIVLDPETFPVLIEINDIPVSVFYTNSSLVNLNVSQFTLQKQANGAPIVSIENYRMETCRTDHLDKLDEKTKNYFLSMNLKDYFCIPKNLKNLTMKGSFDQEIFQTIKFTVSICNNGSSSKQCLSAEEIKQQMNRGFIGIYFPDYNINPGNYLVPKETQPKEVFTNWVVDSQKQIDIFFKNNNLETDDGVLTQDVSTEIISNYDGYTELDFKSEDPDFLMVYLKIKQRTGYYRRSYRKLQEVLAQIGGFINMFWILAFSICYLHSKLVVVTEIIMNVFKIRIFFDDQSKDISTIRGLSGTEKKPSVSGVSKQWGAVQSGKVRPLPAASATSKGEISNEKKNSVGRILTIQKFEEPKNNNFFSVNSLKKNQNSLQGVERVMQDYENLDLTMLDYLYYYTGLFKSPEREKKKTIIIEGEKILQTCLDIKYIIKKFYELEKLKQMLLSEEDLKRFALLPKPELKISMADRKSGGGKSRAMISTLVGKRLDATILPVKGRLVKLNT